MTNESMMRAGESQYREAEMRETEVVRQPARPRDSSANRVTFRIPRKFVYAGAGVVALGTAFLVGGSMGGDSSEPSDPTPVVAEGPTTSTTERKATTTTLQEQLFYNNLCDALTPEFVSSIMNVSPDVIVADKCVSAIPSGIIVENDWQFQGGGGFSALLLDDKVVGEQTTYTEDQRSGFGTFEDFAAGDMAKSYTVTTKDGREYQAAYDSFETRIKVDAYVLMLSSSAGTDNTHEYVDWSDPRSQEMVSDLVERMFDYE